jgi:hypothetical protein
MAIIESTVGTATDVDAAFKALRVSLRPSEVLGWFSLGVPTGNLTGVAVNGAIFSLRNIGTNPLIIRRVGLNLVTTTGFTAAQELRFALNIQRAFTASDSGGTQVAFTGSSNKHRTSLGTLTSVDCRIATTSALTAGTKTSDVNDLTIVQAYAAAAAVGVTVPSSMNNLLSHDAGDYPIILVQNEGINIFNRIVWGAAGVGVAAVNIELAEATSY